MRPSIVPALAASAFALAASAAASAAEPARLGVPAGYGLVWSDEFERPGAPDPSKWAYDTERNLLGWHNGEKQYYSGPREKNARVRDGRLIIEAHAERLDPAEFPDWGGQSYSSARLRTLGKASWTYGYVEARAKLPCEVGTWPAIWTLAEGPWPDSGEIDIMEHVAFDPGVIHHSIHTKAYNHIQGTQKTAQIKAPSACGAFHLYQLHWTADRIVMGVDGEVAFTFDRPSGDPAEWPFDRPQYLLLNLAVGGWGGAKGIYDGDFPARFEVDYVRVYQAGQP